MKFYALYDKLADFYSFYLHSTTDADVKRSLQDLFSADPNHMAVRHCQDFDLYYVGIFDEKERVFTGVLSPVFVCSMDTLSPTYIESEKDKPIVAPYDAIPGYAYTKAGNNA